MFAELPQIVAVLLLNPILPLAGPPTAPARVSPPPVVMDTVPASASVPQAPDVFPAVGKPAPPLAVQYWLNVPAGKTQWAVGKTTTFEAGHVYVLDFTATWCEGCPAMYPMMDTLRQKYAARGLRVLYVTALWGYQGEAPDQELKTLSQYVASHHLSSPVAVAGLAQILTGGYFHDGAVELPKTVLIDGAGVVRAILEDDENAFRKAVSAAVAASHPKTP